MAEGSEGHGGAGWSPGIVTASASWDGVPSMAGRHFVGEWFSASPERNDAFDVVTYVRDNAHQLHGGNFPHGLMEGFYLLALLDHLTNKVVFIDDERVERVELWAGQGALRTPADHERHIPGPGDSERGRASRGRLHNSARL